MDIVYIVDAAAEIRRNGWMCRTNAHPDLVGMAAEHDLELAGGVVRVRIHHDPGVAHEPDPK